MISAKYFILINLFLHIFAKESTFPRYNLFKSRKMQEEIAVTEKVHCNDFLHFLFDSATTTSSLPSTSTVPRVSCLIIINSPSVDFNIVEKLWKHTDIKICADGGANRLFTGIKHDQRKDFIPNYIVGDLDSLENHVRDYYQ
jgi:uncharacterized Rossmann fold enzyme